MPVLWYNKRDMKGGAAMEKDWRLAGAAALAYLGDSVIEVMVRTMLVEQGIYQSRKLNRMALSYVTAAAQARAAPPTC